MTVKRGRNQSATVDWHHSLWYSIGLILWLMLNVSTNAEPLKPLDCRLSAIITSDNDIRIDRDRRPAGEVVALATPITHSIKAVASELLQKLSDEDRRFLVGHCDLLFSEIFEIKAPGKRLLFISHLWTGPGAEYFVVILSDRAATLVTSQPIVIGARWTMASSWQDHLLETPIVSFANLFNDSRRQLVLEERGHNGTMYNAMIYNYFEIGPQLQLKRLLSYEARALSDHPNPGIFRRTLVPFGPRRFRLVTNLERASDAPIPIGAVTIESSEAGQPFHVIKREPIDPQYSWLLVSASGEQDEDSFLRRGDELD